MRKITKRATIWTAAVVMVVAGLAAAFLIDWNPERTRREAFIYHCNEEGAGGMVTSREYCEELYARSKAEGGPANSL